MGYEPIQIGPCTLYCGDCANILPRLPREYTVVTSPPYNRGSRIDARWEGITTASCKASRFRGGYGTCTDDLPWSEYRIWLKKIVGMMWSVVADDGVLWLNHKPRIVNGVLWTPLESVEGLPLRQIVIWNTGPGVNFHPAALVPACEWIMLLARQNWRLSNRAAGGVGDVWTIRPDNDPDHPAPFPLELPLRCLDLSGQLAVLDPFMGRGTTGIACIQLGRKFVGIEQDPQHFQLACGNLERAWQLKQSELPFEKHPVEKQLSLLSEP